MLTTKLLIFYVSLLAVGVLTEGCQSGSKVRDKDKDKDKGKYISLASHLQPRSTEERTWTNSWSNTSTNITQSNLLQRWTRQVEVASDKVFRLGSQQTVSAGEDKGFLSVIMAAYNNHWVLRTRPEDWWTSIAQIIATKIDKVAKEDLVRQFFVSHEGKKTLTVEIGCVDDIDNEWFFQQMISQISQNINKPEYTTLMESDFSRSTSVDRIVNSIMLMYSFQEYFEYRAMILCGIPGVIMEGSEEDWRMLVDKIVKVEEYLKPIEKAVALESWFREVRSILEKLVETFRGNPDRDWWSRIFDKNTQYGSGGGSGVDFLTGWFVTEFLGVRWGELRHVPSGVNVVPLTLATPYGYEEEAALAAGFTGYKVRPEEVTENGVTFPSVQAATGWALLMDPNSPLN